MDFLTAKPFNVALPPRYHVHGLEYYLVIGGAALLFTPAVYLRHKPDLTAKSVESLQGTVTLNSELASKSRLKPSYNTLFIAGSRFVINRGVAMSFKQKDTYIVYFTPQNRILLAAEWVNPLDAAVVPPND